MGKKRRLPPPPPPTVPESVDLMAKLNVKFDALPVEPWKPAKLNVEERSALVMVEPPVIPPLRPRPVQMDPVAGEEEEEKPKLKDDGKGIWPVEGSNVTEVRTESPRLSPPPVPPAATASIAGRGGILPDDATFVFKKTDANERLVTIGSYCNQTCVPQKEKARSLTCNGPLLTYCRDTSGEEGSVHFNLIDKITAGDANTAKIRSIIGDSDYIKFPNEKDRNLFLRVCNNVDVCCPPSSCPPAKGFKMCDHVEIRGLNGNKTLNRQKGTLQLFYTSGDRTGRWDVQLDHPTALTEFVAVKPVNLFKVSRRRLVNTGQPRSPGEEVLYRHRLTSPYRDSPVLLRLLEEIRRAQD